MESAQDRMSRGDTDEITYLTTDQLAARIHYDSRTIRTRLKDAVLKEGEHYIRPFGGRKILFIWERIERDMAVFSTDAGKARQLAKEARGARDEKSQRWSPVEDAHLRRNWGNLSTKEIARELGRTQSSIQSRARTLGLERPDAWTEGELALMRAHYEDEGPTGLELRLGRTRHAIHQQAKRMGLFLRPRHDPWAPEEDEVLRINVGKMSLAEIYQTYFEPEKGHALGKPFARTYAAVAQRCSALGITLSRKDAAASRRSSR